LSSHVTGYNNKEISSSLLQEEDKIARFYPKWLIPLIELRDSKKTAIRLSTGLSVFKELA